MKKTLAIILATLMLGLLCSCGSSSNSNLTDENPLQNGEVKTTKDSNQTSKQNASAPASPGLQVVDGKASARDSINYAEFSFKMKNTSGVTITKMFVEFVILDKDGNIIKEEQAPGSVRVAPGQSITVDRRVDVPEGAYSAVVDHYIYYVGDDEYYIEYVDDSPVVLIP